MKKFFWITVLILFFNNNAFAGIYNKCFIKKINHPRLEKFERKSFSQMQRLPRQNFVTPFSSNNPLLQGNRIFIHGSNNLINGVEIKIFKDIKFETTEDTSLPSFFTVELVKYKTKTVLLDQYETSIFKKKYKVSASSEGYVEYESENSKWGTKLILNKKENIIELKSRMLGVDVVSIFENGDLVDKKKIEIFEKIKNLDLKLYTTSNEWFKSLKDDDIFKYYKPLEENINFEKFYPSRVSIFLKCKFKNFK